MDNSVHSKYFDPAVPPPPLPQSADHIPIARVTSDRRDDPFPTKMHLVKANV